MEPSADKEPLANKRPLAGKTIVVTRPADQANELIAAIEKLGGKGIHFPVMAINTLDEQNDATTIAKCKQRVMELDSYQYVIFISANAVQCGMEWIHNYWPQLPVGIEWFGIGKKTEQILTQQGVPVGGSEHSQLSSAMNSEALLTDQRLQQLTGEKVLIFRGKGGRDFLAEQLQGRGATVDYAECYARSKQQHPAGHLKSLYQQNAFDAMLVNSGESIDYLYDYLKDDQIDLAVMQQTTIVVPSNRVKVLANEQGFQKVVVADNATDQIMVAAVTQALVNTH